MQGLRLWLRTMRALARWRKQRRDEADLARMTDQERRDIGFATCDRDLATRAKRWL